MVGKNRLSESIAACTVFRYVGPGYIVGLPARDLTERDLLEIEEREGKTRMDIAALRIYEPVEFVEVQPFCGIQTDQGRCRALVEEWGLRCPEHMEAPNDTPSI